jgi:ferredoxin-type protein NapH
MIKKIFSLSKLRLLVITLVIGITVAGTSMQKDWGTLCSYCPLGMFEVMLAGKVLFLPKYLLSVLGIMIGAFFLGKVFCAWACPTTFVKNIFGINGKKNTQEKCNNNDSSSCSGCSAFDSSKSESEKESNKSKNYLAYGALAGAFAASFIVGFPVFCLVCPMGLFFGFIFAMWKVSTVYQPGWELVIFPAILMAELYLLRSWCSSICPIGFMFKILGKFGSLLKFKIKPVMDVSNCMNDMGCSHCEDVCPEKLKLHNGDESIDDCTMCLECYVKCPESAVKLKTQA